VGAEPLVHAGAGEGVWVTAVGEETVAAGGDEKEAVQEPVGSFDGVGVGGELGPGDVADDGDVGGGGPDRGGPGEQGEGSAVPGGA
jgi:hypothetical protein